MTPLRWCLSRRRRWSVPPTEVTMTTDELQSILRRPMPRYHDMVAIDAGWRKDHHSAADELDPFVH
jgi:hypothetical protein